MANSEPTPNTIRGRVLLGLLLILALATGLRAYHVERAVIISPDSALFIAYARMLAEDPLAAVRQFAQHPLYPALILLFHRFAGSFVEGPSGWILAGRLAAITGSLAAILAMYWFASRLYDRTRGLLAAGMLALLPDACRYGADVLSDLPHLALYLGGLAALLAGMHTQRSHYFPLAAAGAALAFLTRPEGAAVLLVGLGVLALHRAWTRKRRAALGAAMLVAFICLVAPYQLATGKVIQKKSPLELFKFGFVTRSATWEPLRARAASVGEQPWVPRDDASVAATLPVPVDVLRQWTRAGRVVYVLLAILGVAVARPRGTGGRILSFALGIHLLLLYALESRYGYLDRRHALILVALSLPVAAAGAWWLGGSISTRARAAREAVQLRTAIGIVTLCVVLTGPWLLRPINPGEEHVVAAARWIAANTPPGTLIVADSRLRRVALYADRAYAEWPWWDGGVDDLAGFLKRHPSGWFVVDSQHITRPERNPRFFEQLEQQLGDRLKLQHVEHAPPHARHATEVRVYRYEPRAPRWPESSSGRRHTPAIAARPRE